MPGLQERERARRRDSAHDGRCGTGNQQLARRPTWAAAGEGVVMGCNCDLCKMIGRFADIRAKLPADDAQFLEDFVENYLEEGLDKEYYEAVIDGSWPGSVDIMRGWIRMVLGRDRIALTDKGRELLEQSKK